MIIWLNPGALAGLAFALGPLLVHLLRRRQSKRTVVPSVRFIPPVSQSSMRVRPPDDLILLALRTAALVAAVLALAGPLLVTVARQAAWEGRMIRAVVVDTSASAAREGREEIIARELQGVHAGRRFDARLLGDGLQRASAWLGVAPPGRREVVVVSDFPHGALSGAEVRRLPTPIGLRFVTAAGVPASGRIDDGREFIEGQPFARHLTLDASATGLTLSPASSHLLSLRIEGAPADVVARIERIVRGGGVATGPASGATIVRFGAEMAAAPSPPSAPGAATRAALRLMQDPTVRGSHVSASGDGDTLVVRTSVAPGSYDAVEVVHAALDAWRDPAAHEEREVESIAADTLAAWTREAAPSDAAAWRHADRSDGRWLWVLSLVCLAAESLVRRRAAAIEEDHARAA